MIIPLKLIFHVHHSFLSFNFVSITSQRNNDRGDSRFDFTLEAPSVDVLAMMNVMKKIMQALQQQITVQQKNIDNYEQQNALFRERPLATQKTISTAIAKVVVPKEPRQDSVSDFRRLLPDTFAGTRKPLDAEQWLVDMNNLLSAVRIPDEDMVEVVKIQLMDVARTWWLTEEDRLKEPITCKQSTESFDNKFF